LGIRRLLYDIIRQHPQWLYSICVDPHKLQREEHFPEALDIYKYFEEYSVINFIVSNFHKMRLSRLLSEMLKKLNLRFSSDFKIARELELLIKTVKDPSREYITLPDDKYRFLTPQGDLIDIYYAITNNEYLKTTTFEMYLSFTCTFNHHNEFTFNRHQLSTHLKDNKPLRMWCYTCHRELHLELDFKAIQVKELGEASNNQMFFNSIIPGFNISNMAEILESFPVQTHKNSLKHEVKLKEKLEYDKTLKRDVLDEEAYTKIFDSVVYSEEDVIVEPGDSKGGVYFKGLDLNREDIHRFIEMIYRDELDYEMFKIIFTNATGLRLASEIDWELLIFKLIEIAEMLLPFSDYLELVKQFFTYPNNFKPIFENYIEFFILNMIRGEEGFGSHYKVNNESELEARFHELEHYKNCDFNRNTLQYICSMFKNLHKEVMLKQINFLIKIRRRIEKMRLRSEIIELKEYGIDLKNH